MERCFGFLADNLYARAVDLADESKVRRLHEAPLGARTEALAFGYDGLGADGITADDIDTQFGAVAGEGLGKGLDHVRADACGSAREGSDQRRAVRQLGYGGVDDAEAWHCEDYILGNSCLAEARRFLSIYINDEKMFRVGRPNILMIQNRPVTASEANALLIRNEYEVH